MEYPEPKPPVRILQRPEEIARLLEIFKKIQPMNILEIGSFCGGTLWYWLHYASKEAKIVSVDAIIQDQQATEQRKSREAWPEWMKNTQDDVRLYPYLEYTDSIAFDGILYNHFAESGHKNFIGDGIDFAFIDGGHDYLTVQNDVEKVLPRMNPGGAMALHDIHTPDNGEIQVSTFWQEFLITIPRGRVKSIEEIGTTHGIEGGIGSGIGVVYT